MISKTLVNLSSRIKNKILYTNKKVTKASLQKIINNLKKDQEFSLMINRKVFIK